MYGRTRACIFHPEEGTPFQPSLPGAGNGNWKGKCKSYCLSPPPLGPTEPRSNHILHIAVLGPVVAVNHVIHHYCTCIRSSWKAYHNTDFRALPVISRFRITGVVRPRNLHFSHVSSPYPHYHQRFCCTQKPKNQELLAYHLTLR